MIKLTFPNILDQSVECRTVVDFYKAIFGLDEARLLQMVTDDCTYVVHGAVTWQAKPGLVKMLAAIQQGGPAEVRIDNIVADTKHAAINGMLVLGDGSQLACAEFLTFSPEQKIQRVDAYAVAPAS